MTRAVFSLSREMVDTAAAAVAKAMRAAEIVAEGDERQLALIKSEVIGAVRREIVLFGATNEESFEWLGVVLAAMRNSASLRDLPTVGTA